MLKIIKEIWGYVQIAGIAIIVAAVFLFTKSGKTVSELNKIQKEKEREAREDYEKMSDDDVVDGLGNANDIHNTARDGGAKRADSFRALFRN